MMATARCELDSAFCKGMFPKYGGAEEDTPKGKELDTGKELEELQGTKHQELAYGGRIRLAPSGAPGQLQI